MANSEQEKRDPLSNEQIIFRLQEIYEFLNLGDFRNFKDVDSALKAFADRELKTETALHEQLLKAEQHKYTALLGAIKTMADDILDQIEGKPQPKTACAYCNAVLVPSREPYFITAHRYFCDEEHAIAWFEHLINGFKETFESLKKDLS